MSTKKCFVALAVAVCLAATLWGQESKDPNENVWLLQEKIKRLEKTAEFQQKKYEELKADYVDIKKQLDEQVQENERLKALVKNTDIVTESVKSKFDPNNGIIYLGKQRDKLWFDKMYKMFCNKIAFVDNKYVNIIGGDAQRPHRPESFKGEFSNIEPHSMTWPIGTPVCFGYDGEVVSVLKKGEILVTNGAKYDSTIIVHVYGLEGNFADGQEVILREIPLIYAGTFEYTSAGGAHKTVPSLVVYKPLTKEQFADAIKSGIRLITQREVNGKITEIPIR